MPPRRTRRAPRGPRREKSLAEQYHPYLQRLMEFKDGVAYAKAFQFTQEQLLSITPRDIVRWMCRDAYGTPDPGPDDHPTGRRSSGLSFAKKAISFFMPHKNMHWNVESEHGNPTKSLVVNDLLKQIKKAEVRKQGKASNAKRDMKRQEFRKTLRMLERQTDFHRRYKATCMAKFQFHIIGRGDDISNIETMDLREHELFGDFALQTKVSWSKNVLEERDCPDQILIGADDTDFCVLLALATYLECRFNSERKPASQFTAAERSACKCTFSRRNQVWKIIRRMVDAGIDSDVACDRFYQAYGHTKSVTAIINCVYADRKNGRGVHPNLRV
jgi:hypothetical protein